MEKLKLLRNLDKATDKAAVLTIKAGLTPDLSKKYTLINDVYVKKNNNGYYDIMNLHKEAIYKNISLFDIAITIAQKYTNGDRYSIRKILFLENKFFKHYTDMLHYLNCMKIAKKNKDYERLAILEDKFQTSELIAKNIRDTISTLKD